MSAMVPRKAQKTEVALTESARAAYACGGNDAPEQEHNNDHRQRAERVLVRRDTDPGIRQPVLASASTVCRIVLRQDNRERYEEGARAPEHSSYGPERTGFGKDD
jgi:hypothetical protein